MLVDKPLRVEEILGDKNERERVRFLLNTINTLVKDSPHGSVSVSISGDWGSGKTTYLRLIESYYRDLSEFPVIFYEAWRYRGEENPLVPLILEIRDIPGIESEIWDRLSELLKPILTSGIALSDILLNILTGKGIESIEKALELIEKEQLPLVSKYREDLRHLGDTIKEIKERFTPDPEKLLYKEKWREVGFLPFDGKRLFVLIIDDLDRLLPNEAFRVIETLRFYFDIDGLLIIMGINDEILNRYIVEHYTTGDERRGERFLEKIFHWNYELSYAELNPLHLRSLEKVVDETTLGKIKHILSQLDPLTHRKWIKILNRIENGILWEGNGYQEVLEWLIFSALLKELYPRVEFYSRRFPRLLEALYKGEWEEEPIIKEALERIKGDKSFLYFPEKSYNMIKEMTRPITVMERK